MLEGLFILTTGVSIVTGWCSVAGGIYCCGGGGLPVLDIVKLLVINLLYFTLPCHKVNGSSRELMIQM